MKKLSSAQRFVLAEMHKSGPAVKLSSNYITTRYALSRKGLIELNQDRGLYELTDAGRAALEGAQAGSIKCSACRAFNLEQIGQNRAQRHHEGKS